MAKSDFGGVTLDEFRVAKGKLEGEILSVLRGFEVDYGVRVVGLDFSSCHVVAVVGEECLPGVTGIKLSVWV